MDTDSTLQEYQIQLEQVEIALKSDPENEELLKLKTDLIEVIDLTKELIKEETEDHETVQTKATKAAKTIPKIEWKSNDKCMAIWRVDGKYYPAIVDQILDDGTCTVIFDGYSTHEITQVGQLMPYNKNNMLYNDTNSSTKTSSSSQVGHKKAFTKKELEAKLKEAKKRKKEKFALKLKALDELSEKEKNKWKVFNTKLASKTWKGVVRKNKFDYPEHHENKIGVGTNSLVNRTVTPNGSMLTTNSSASASAAVSASSAKHRHITQSYKTSTFN